MDNYTDKSMVEFKTQDVVVNRSQIPQVNACAKQGIPLREVFAKVINNGQYTEVSYPLVYLQFGKIPVNDDGNIISDKSLAAKMMKLAKGAHEYKVVYEHIHDAFDGIIQ